MAEKLPLEILCQIFEYLTLSDRIQCALVSKHFYQAFRLSKCSSKLLEKTYTAFENDEEFLKNFGAFQSFENVVGGLTMKKISSFRLLKDAPLFVSNLTSLSLDDCSDSSRELVHILRLADSLKELALTNCREMFISGLPLFKPEEVFELRRSLSNVEVIDLSYNQFINDAIFVNLIECLDNVNSIVLDGCKIFCMQLAPPVANEPSPSRLTFQFLEGIISKKATKIRKLSFNKCSIDANSLKRLGAISELKIREINLSDCSGVSQDAIVEFSQSQAQLEKLNIDLCRRTLIDNPEKSLMLFQSLLNLTTLSIRCLSMPKGFSDCLIQLDKLKHLDISDVDIPSGDITKAIEFGKFTLKSLAMINFTFKPDDLISVMPRLCDVEELNLTSAAYGTTDQVLLEIIKHLRKLRKFQLQNCTRLSDLGFAGIELGDDGVLQVARENGRIFLGSRAEAEILTQAKKQEQISQKMSSLQSKSTIKIDDLNLTFLDVAKVPISDVSILAAFNFRELRHINVSACKLIADSGFVTLAENNRGLEKVIAKGTNVTDAGLAAMIAHLPRLLHLDVESCIELTSESIRQIPDFCKNLKFLNVSFCLQVKVFAVEEVQRKIRSLHRLEMRGLYIGECFDSD